MHVPSVSEAAAVSILNLYIVYLKLLLPSLSTVEGNWAGWLKLSTLATRLAKKVLSPYFP